MLKNLMIIGAFLSLTACGTSPVASSDVKKACAAGVNVELWTLPIAPGSAWQSTYVAQMVLNKTACVAKVVECQKRANNLTRYGQVAKAKCKVA